MWLLLACRVSARHNRATPLQRYIVTCARGFLSVSLLLQLTSVLGSRTAQLTPCRAGRLYQPIRIGTSEHCVQLCCSEFDIATARSRLHRLSQYLASRAGKRWLRHFHVQWSRRATARSRLHRLSQYLASRAGKRCHFHVRWSRCSVSNIYDTESQYPDTVTCQ
jgi:hypothetical protein